MRDDVPAGTIGFCFHRRGERVASMSEPQSGALQIARQGSPFVETIRVVEIGSELRRGRLSTIVVRTRLEHGPSPAARVVSVVRFESRQHAAGTRRVRQPERVRSPVGTGARI